MNIKEYIKDLYDAYILKKKYKYIRSQDYNGKRYHQIQAIKNFTHYTYAYNGFDAEETKEIKKGNIGGYIEDESCLSHKGNCWIDYGSYVSDGIRISGNAWVDKFIRINSFDKMKLDIYDNVRISADIFNESISKLEKTCSVGGYTKINAPIYIRDNFEISGYNIEINDSLVFKKALDTQYDNELVFRSPLDIDNYIRTMSLIERIRSNISNTNRFYGDNNSNQEFAFDFRYIKPNPKVSSAESKPKEESIKPTVKNALDYIEIK